MPVTPEEDLDSLPIYETKVGSGGQMRLLIARILAG